MSKTANELKNEYKALQDKISGHRARIWERLIKLATAHPDAVVDEFQNTKVKAKFIVDFPHITRMYTVDKKLAYIESIERWLEKQNPSKQLNLFN